LGFASLPLRAVLFAATQLPAAVVLVQPLEGLGAAVFGVMLPLVAADLTRGTGRYNLCLGLFGFMGALGAAASTTLAGVMADALSPEASFLALSAVGLLAFALVGTAMPETYANRPAEQAVNRIAT
jgi:MFS family permease